VDSERPVIHHSRITTLVDNYLKLDDANYEDDCLCQLAKQRHSPKAEEPLDNKIVVHQSYSKPLFSPRQNHEAVSKRHESLHYHQRDEHCVD
jgi:hypothetical protein